MKMHTYLYFDGQCAEAFEFYATLFGGDPKMMSYNQAPEDAGLRADSWEDRVLHARLSVGDTTLLGSDIPACDDYQPPGDIRVTLEVDDPDEAVRLFDALSEEGTIDLDLETTFWAQQFAMVTDRFGIPWMINCPK